MRPIYPWELRALRAHMLFPGLNCGRPADTSKARKSGPLLFVTLLSITRQPHNNLCYLDTACVIRA